jgi:hypothetical protein
VLRGGLVTIAGDPVRKVIYGMMAPTGGLYRYDVAAKTTTRLGRPAYQRTYVYAGRALWLNGSGRVYFTAGNNNGAQTGGSYS